MTAFASATAALSRGARHAGRPVVVFLKDAGHGLLEVSHSSLALVGLTVVGLCLFLASRPDMRQTLELEAFGWLQSRQVARVDTDPSVVVALAEPDAVQRATAIDPRELSKQQAAVATWISRRYKVAVEPVSRLVQEAWSVGQRTRLDPTLILAIMAIESGFNPFAQSPVGAQGLMQVMTRVHDDKYESFGGNHAAFDPVTNLRVGVQVLKECIARAGSLEGGLKFYVGAANLADDGGYAGKVLAEQAHLRSVAAGKSVPPSAPSIPLPVIVPPTPNIEAAEQPREDDERVALLR
ncbi:lytic transglycosylase domain-containing protein [Rivibacter subsaxonicus]|uniref:Transglycosylase-like protein with SLT domain n=1 Tax=Rivibacter subsaxonicus TaxID=457575 RepID=A0A4Q7VPA8_9BURK|nr:lytic transglycosylase domain-containing protein [Rivibacter subsaxonicus]RZT97958.1 transglycosylase-like protein with SLT domain [Rivibacter subsaxonicus]